MALTMRRKPVSRPDPGIWRQGVSGSKRQAAAAFRRGREANPVRANHAVGLPGLGIVDNLPECIPVSQRELDVIETYLGDLLDQALGRPQ
jgi:hypothetical protein